MKTLKPTSLLLSLAVTTFLVTACNQQPEGNVLATYDGGTITQQQVEEKLAELVPNNMPNANPPKFAELKPEMQEGIIRDMIAERLIQEQSKKQHYEKRDDIKKSIDRFTDQLVQQEFLKEKSEAEIAEDKIKERYEQIKKELDGKDETRARHILVDSKAKADALYKQLKSDKGKFAELAKKNTLDKASAANGGDVGYFVDGQMVPEFESAAKQVKNGEISQPFKTQFGWHVMEVTDRRPAKIAEYEDIKPMIKKQLQQESVNNYLDDLLKEANIFINVKNVQADDGSAVEKADTNQNAAAGEAADAAKASEEAPAEKSASGS